MDGTKFLLEFLLELDPYFIKRIERLYVHYVLPKNKEII